MLCKKCGKKFGTKIRINGKIHNLNRRKYCLECSPFKQHNTRILEGRTYSIGKTKDISHICNLCKKTYFLKIKMKNGHCPSCSVVMTRRRSKEEGVKFLGGRCQICGYDKCIAALEFHHLDPQTKKRAISGNTMSREKMLEETEKCLLLCCRCHREHHAGILDLHEALKKKAVNADVDGSSPSVGDFDVQHAENYRALVDVSLYDSCRLDND